MKLYKCSDGRCNIAGTRIRQIREQKNMSQEELAAALQLAGLNLNQKSISRIETGERVLPDFELVYFSKVLKISPLDLLKVD